MSGLNSSAVWPLFQMVYALPPACEPANDADDAACADAVTAFRGDINPARHMYTLLGIVLLHNAPRTLAALGARGDVDPYHVFFADDDPEQSCSAVYLLLCWRQGYLGAFLAAFPTFDFDAPCRSLRRRFDDSPLHVLHKLWRSLDDPKTILHVLLDAGADCSKELFVSLCWRAGTLASFSPHVAWLQGERRAWMIACVALAVGAATVRFSALVHVLADTLRVCMPPQTSGQPSHQLVSEYAGMVAAFL